MKRLLAACMATASLSCASPGVSPLPSASGASTSTATQPPAMASIPERGEASPLLGELPRGSVVPSSVAATDDRVPFLLVLHGYGGTGRSFTRHFQLSRLAEKRRFIYLAPDGEPDAQGNRFWNAGAACCNFENREVDHVRLLATSIEQARAATRIDPNRVYVLGYSNGGFMAHRLGCDVPGIRGILSVAGAGVADTAACMYAPDTVLEVHGDADPVVPFEGGNVLSRKNVAAHPGAIATVTAWANKKGCMVAPRVLGTLDLEAGLPDAETEHLNFSCAEHVTLLKVRGAGHSLASSPPAIDALMDLLMR